MQNVAGLWMIKKPACSLLAVNIESKLSCGPWTVLWTHKPRQWCLLSLFSDMELESRALDRLISPSSDLPMHNQVILKITTASTLHQILPSLCTGPDWPSHWHESIICFKYLINAITTNSCYVWKQEMHMYWNNTELYTLLSYTVSWKYQYQLLKASFIMIN